VAADDDTIHFSASFAHLVFTGTLADAVTNAAGRASPEYDLMLVERAKAAFARASQSHAEINAGLAELRNQVRELARLRRVIGGRSA
jgi:hypothetical protein